jgi:hypothetical protein
VTVRTDGYSMATESVMCGGAERRRTPWYTEAVSGVSAVSGIYSMRDNCVTWIYGINFSTNER